mmetsp:Transcript_60021/g.144231  ORF Transcript_60021/g.144231 Transcript_60021/m.144231 type:complete len:202 (-) Transcript_60021:701-1306(-)
MGGHVALRRGVARHRIVHTALCSAHLRLWIAHGLAPRPRNHARRRRSVPALLQRALQGHQHSLWLLGHDVRLRQQQRWRGGVLARPVRRRQGLHGQLDVTRAVHRELLQRRPERHVAQRDHQLQALRFRRLRHRHREHRSRHFRGRQRLHQACNDGNGGWSERALQLQLRSTELDLMHAEQKDHPEPRQHQDEPRLGYQRH